MQHTDQQPPALPYSHAEVLGIKPWKRWQIDCFLRHSQSTLHYAGSAEQALRGQARHGGCIVVWAGREPEELARAAAAQRAPLLRIEDGFLRSVGLGSNHVGGASLVVDPDGIYFDPRRPSLLENLLQHEESDEATLERAARLRQFLVRQGLTKYNVGRRQALRLGGAGRSRLLVPGQVEDDASIRFGAGAVNTNLELLRKVRETQPGAWIVYKPHPDIEAGTRPGQVDRAQVLRYADEIVEGASAAVLFGQVDEIHTMTSLLGFEALLRGIPVTTWGQPFYSGWGLTHDQHPLARRTRRLSLDALVAAALLHYPLYADLNSRQRCSAEQVAEHLAAAPSAGGNDDSALRRHLRLLRGLHRSWRSAREQR